MIRKKLTLALLAAALCAFLCACGNVTAAPEADTADTDPGANIFISDLTAIDFLEGTWTNNRAQYIVASRGETMLITWNTNIPLPQSEIYVLRNGVLVGANADGAETELLYFEYVDGDSITVHDLVNGQETLFVRDSLEVDETRLDNEYVFWSMDRASKYLSGMWMNDDGSYFTFIVDEAGAVSFNTDLPCPECDYIEFYDGDLCGFIAEADGTVVGAPIFTFDIISEDEVNVLCVSDESESVFRRLSRDLDAELLNSEYVFANNQRAFTFLDGRWQEDGWHYFRVGITDGGVTWSTNLPLDDTYQSYGFADGCLVGTVTDENGETEDINIYSFRIISENELEVTVCDTDETYILIREE